MRISYSLINTYLQCKYKFKLHYVDKLFLFKETEATQKGKKLHENIYNYFINDSLLDSEIQSNLSALKSAVSRAEIAILEEKQYVNNFMYIPDFLIIKNDIAFLCDFKTGKVPILKYLNYKQLDFYAWLIFLQNPHVKLVYSQYMYVIFNKVFKKRYDRSTDEKMLHKYFLSLLHAIQHEQKFLKQESALCQYCIYREKNLCTSSKKNY